MEYNKLPLLLQLMKAMVLKQEKFSVQTPGRGIIEITRQIQDIVEQSGITSGLCQVFLGHTSASLLFCENYDPNVRRDLEAFMKRLVPDGDTLYKHDAEGPDDMPAHVRSVLTQNSLSVPISNGKLGLGQWQGIFLWEHRINAHERKVIVTILGNS